MKKRKEKEEEKRKTQPGGKNVPGVEKTTCSVDRPCGIVGWLVGIMDIYILHTQACRHPEARWLAVVFASTSPPHIRGARCRSTVPMQTSARPHCSFGAARHRPLGLWGHQKSGLSWMRVAACLFSCGRLARRDWRAQRPGSARVGP